MVEQHRTRQGGKPQPQEIPQDGKAVSICIERARICPQAGTGCCGWADGNDSAADRPDFTRKPVFVQCVKSCGKAVFRLGHDFRADGIPDLPTGHTGITVNISVPVLNGQGRLGRWAFGAAMRHRCVRRLRIAQTMLWHDGCNCCMRATVQWADGVCKC